MSDIPRAAVASESAPAPVADAADTAPAPRTAAAQELGLAAALWQRDMLRLIRDPARWIGVVLQPMLFWALLGSGMSSVFTLSGIGDLDYFQYFFPGLLVMVVLFTTIFAMMAVIEDRQHGVLQQVLTAPGSRVALVAGKTAGVATVALAQIVLTLVAAPLAGFDVTEVHWPLFIAAFILGTIGLTAMSFTFAWVLRSTGGYHAIMAVFLLPLWMVSGAMFPAPGGWIDAIMYANPMSYMVDGFRHALHGGLAPLGLVGPGVALAALGAFAVVTLALAVAVSRRHPGATR